MLNIIQRFLNYSFALVLVALLAGCWPDSSPPSPSASITSQPVDVSVVQGSPATFSVVATGTGLAYQWQSSSDAGASWSGISGANASSYSIASTSLADNGKRFRVLVSSSDGSSATSSAAKLSVVTAPIAPSISVQPAPQSVVEPAAASFSVTASGTALAYQWQICADTTATPTCAQWNNVAGTSGNAATYTIPSTVVGLNGIRLRVLVSNSLGSVASNPVTLSVSAAPITPTTPSFSTQPANASVVAPSVATFNVAATGNPAPTVQWQISTNAGSTWSDIGGATSSSYSTAATSVADTGKLYRAIASNSVGSATSTMASLSVAPTPVVPSFSSQPVSASVTAGQSASFTVAASGTPTPNLQWQLSTDAGATWSNINGATGSSYSIAVTALANTGSQYRAVASNTVGSVNSNAATLTVTAVLIPPLNVPLDLQKAVAVGENFTCAIKADTTLACWGRNTYGTLGDGSLVDKSAAVIVPGLSGVVNVVAGVRHVCALKSDGTAKCWGDNSIGQIGNPSTLTSPVNSPVAVTGLIGAISLTAHSYHTCALKTDASVVCWGSGGLGQLGDGMGTNSSSPLKVAGLTGATAVSAGNYHTCALKSDTSVACWGYNFNGQLGNNTTTASLSPVAVQGLTGVASISAGEAHTCAIKTDGTTVCWGRDIFGELGNTAQVDQHLPVTATELAGSAYLDASFGYTCAVTTGGQVKCLGYVSNSQFAVFTPLVLNVLNAYTEPGIAGAIGLRFALYHGCVLSTGGSLTCMGGNDYGELGLGSIGNDPSTGRAYGPKLVGTGFAQ